MSLKYHIYAVSIVAEDIKQVAAKVCANTVLLCDLNNISSKQNIALCLLMELQFSVVSQNGVVIFAASSAISGTAFYGPKEIRSSHDAS